MLKLEISDLKNKISALKPDVSERKLDINILLLLYVAILLGLGALGLATKTDVVLAKPATVQATTSPGVKIDGFDVQATATSPGAATGGPAAESK